MNKLTEIQDCIKTLLNPDQTNLDPFHTAADKLEENKVWWICNLISLLEEKDKAISFYAEYDNHKWKVEAGDYFMTKYTNVTQDNGKIARKALNTSSNSEGE